MRARFIALLLIVHLPSAAAAQHVPTVDDLLNVKTAGGAHISPDGKWVAYTVSEADFKQNAFITQVWLANAATGRSVQLTRGEKSATSPQWSPDSQWLAFTSQRVGDKTQIFVLHPDGGEALQLTKAENSVGAFDWSPDGKTIAFTASDADPKVARARQEYLGGYEVVREEYEFRQLWTLDIAEALKSPVAGTQITKGTAYTVGSFSWAPDGSRIAFSATVNPDLIQGGTADIYLITVADKSVKKLVGQAGPDTDPVFSPDGRMLVFSSAMGRPNYFHANSRLAIIPIDGGLPRSITDTFDESPDIVAWNAAGLFFSGSQKTTWNARFHAR